MAKHNEIVNNFKAILDDFDFNNKEHKYLVGSQAFLSVKILIFHTKTNKNVDKRWTIRSKYYMHTFLGQIAFLYFPMSEVYRVNLCLKIYSMVDITM